MVFENFCCCVAGTGPHCIILCDIIVTEKNANAVVAARSYECLHFQFSYIHALAMTARSKKFHKK